MDSIPMYDSNERTTLDGEWTHEELDDNIYDECVKLIPKYEQRHAGRAVYDRDLYLPQFLAEKIKTENGDLIEIYNREADKHRNENKFGICWFDKWIETQVKCIMNANLVGGK